MSCHQFPLLILFTLSNADSNHMREVTIRKTQRHRHHPPSSVSSRARDRQTDNQGIRDHLGEVQNELRDLADYIYEKVVSTPVLPSFVQLEDHSAGRCSVVSWGSPRGAPDYPPILHCDWQGNPTACSQLPILLALPVRSLHLRQRPFIMSQR